MDWLLSTLNPPEEHFNVGIYTKTYNWVDRYRQARDATVARADKPVQLTGEKAVGFITHADFTDREPTVDGHDPTRLQQNAHVELFPTDGGGFTHQDHGRLVKLSRNEVAIAVQSASGQEVRVHAPRWNFRGEGAGNRCKAIGCSVSSKVGSVHVQRIQCRMRVLRSAPKTSQASAGPFQCLASATSAMPALYG